MWKRRPTLGPTIKFGRDAIELIFKIKIAFEDLRQEYGFEMAITLDQTVRSPLKFYRSFRTPFI